MITTSARPSSSAGPDTAGPVTTTIMGTMPELRTISRAAPPQPTSASSPSPTSAPLEAMNTTNGTRSWRATRAASASVSPSGRVNAPRLWDGVEADHDRRPPTEGLDDRRDRAGHAGSQRQRDGHRRWDPPGAPTVTRAPGRERRRLRRVVRGARHRESGMDAELGGSLGRHHVAQHLAHCPHGRRDESAAAQGEVRPCGSRGRRWAPASSRRRSIRERRWRAGWPGRSPGRRATPTAACRRSRPAGPASRRRPEPVRR